MSPAPIPSRSLRGLLTLSTDAQESTSASSTENQFRQPIEGIQSAVDSLAALSAATLELLDHEKRLTSRIDLHDVVADLLTRYDPFLTGRDVEVVRSLAETGRPFLRGQCAAIESIITNLLNNSVAAFEDAATQRRIIEISSEISNLRWSLSVSDSGPGIVGIPKSEIWLPGRTTRRSGDGSGADDRPRRQCTT